MEEPHETAPLLGPRSGQEQMPQPPPDEAETQPGFKSYGVARAEAVAETLTLADRIGLFVAIFLVGYAYGLESQVRATFQPYATSDFALHSYQATVNVLRNVVAVAVQPTAAKVADVFGRFEVIALATVLYTLGIAVEATAQSVYVFCAGSIIYQAGYTCIVLMLEVLIADFSSMRARVFFSYIPAIPFLVNTWISGNITSAVLGNTSWRWGIGMWGIIYPVASLPLLVGLYSIERRARQSPAMKGYQTPFQLLGLRRMSVELGKQLDLVGLFTLVAAFSLVLAPLTVAGGKAAHWQSVNILAPLFLGVCCIPLFVLWEKKGASTPLIPFHLLGDRGVWSALAVRSMLNFAWYIQGNYLYTILIVAFDFSIQNATRIQSFFSFFGVVSGVIVGLVIFKIRRLKYIIVGGTCLFMVAFGLLIAYPGDPSRTSKMGIVGAQVLLGIAGGLFAYPTQASIQASATREHVAILTGLYLSFYNVGSAFGTCVSGAIWSQTLYPTLRANLGNDTLAQALYDSPFVVIREYPVGTEIRHDIVRSYSHVQTLLCITGICLCVPMIGFALALRNPKLSETEVQPEAENDVEG